MKSTSMKSTPTSFSLAARLLHWLMAPLLLAMPLIGTGMVNTVSAWRPWLADIHKPLGLALLALAIARLLLRISEGKENAQRTISSAPGWQQRMAALSHFVLYGAMLIMPLLGWGMLSAAGYPLPGIGAFHLPAIAPQNVVLYACLRYAHGACGILFFAAIVVHVAAGLLHALILKDGVFSGMALSLKNRNGTTVHASDQR
ncbi:cytochrome b [Undibacterium sp.]|uniref:cytochrome b n=1 Tax=Undibacterium sp. TaxID=1914977 RepID=UPI00374D0FF5